MKVGITEECISCEKCVEICPKVFQMGEVYAEVKTENVLPENENLIRQAAEECPTSAIIVED